MRRIFFALIAALCLSIPLCCSNGNSAATATGTSLTGDTGTSTTTATGTAAPPPGMHLWYNKHEWVRGSGSWWWFMTFFETRDVELMRDFPSGKHQEKTVTLSQEEYDAIMEDAEAADFPSLLPEYVDEGIASTTWTIIYQSIEVSVYLDAAGVPPALATLINNLDAFKDKHWQR